MQTFAANFLLKNVALYWFLNVIITNALFETNSVATKINNAFLLELQP